MTNPYTGNDDLYHVRATIERATNSSPVLAIDWPTFSLVQAWCQFPDKLAIILATLTERVQSTAPSSFKAIILLQALPPKSLIPLIFKIEPLTMTADNPYIANIAKSLLEAVRKEKAGMAEADAKLKWDLWSERYGHSQVGWLPLPIPLEPEWGWYGMRRVDPDEWWRQRPEP